MAILINSRSDISGLDKSLWDKIVAEARRVPKNVAKVAAKAKSLKKPDTSAETDQSSTASMPVQYEPQGTGMSTSTKIGIGLAGLGVVTLAGILLLKVRK